MSVKPHTDEPEREEKKNSGENEKQRIPSLAEEQEEVARRVAEKKARQPGTEPRRKTSPVQGRIIPIAEADATTEALYAKRQRIFPREVHGTFATLRVAMAGLTLGI